VLWRGDRCAEQMGGVGALNFRYLRRNEGGTGGFGWGWWLGRSGARCRGGRVVGEVSMESYRCRAWGTRGMGLGIYRVWGETAVFLVVLGVGVGVGGMRGVGGRWEGVQVCE